MSGKDGVYCFHDGEHPDKPWCYSDQNSQLRGNFATMEEAAEAREKEVPK